MSRKGISAIILTITDSRKLSDDKSGDTLEELLERSGLSLVERHLISDDAAEISSKLTELSNRIDVDLILTTGGTGLGPRDNTPEATLMVIEREVPGIAEAIRRETYRYTPMAMLSRGVAGTLAGTLIINLPGSPKAVVECFQIIKPILEHALSVNGGNTQH